MGDLTHTILKGGLTKLKMLIVSILLLIAPLEQDVDKELILKNDKNQVMTTVKYDDYVIHFFGLPIIYQEKLDQLIKEVSHQVYRAPINARLNTYGQIIEGKPGKRLNKRQLKDELERFFYGEHSSEIEVPIVSLYPKVSSELLAEISVRKIGDYVTYYNEYNKERSHNIRLSANAINNYVVFPNENFSFNEVVGERTEEKGYLRAPVIVKGEFAEDIGGGICQVSSTLYNAVDLRGIQIVERYSHSRSVPYVPPGRDATVSWWGPDFVFKNRYSHPILIRAQAQDGKMMVSIYTAEDVRYLGDS